MIFAWRHTSIQLKCIRNYFHEKMKIIDSIRKWNFAPVFADFIWGRPFSSVTLTESPCNFRQASCINIKEINLPLNEFQFWNGKKTFQVLFSEL